MLFRDLSERVATVRALIAADKYPRTAAALDELQNAVGAEFKRYFRKRMATFRTKQNKIAYLNRKVSALQRQVRSHTETKTLARSLTTDWILKVILASPHTSGRSLAESFHLVAGFDRTTVSRPSIGKIKAAWVEMYLSMVKSKIRDTVAAHLRPCANGMRTFLPVTLVHVQDEADIRLRSGDARETNLLKRGRASKVQCHVMRFCVGHHEMEIPTELEALGDKGTGTLATVLEGLMRRTFREILGEGDTGPEIWAIHLLIGDAVPTNDSAARVIWATVKACPLGERIRYFLLTVKCMTHQTGLAAKSGVVGSSASAAGGNDDVTGIATRLFKYLLNDYYEEFCTIVTNWIAKNLNVVGYDEAERTLLGRGQDVHNLRELYTAHVVPDEMVALWNVGASDLSHRLSPGADAFTSRPALVIQFTTFIVKVLMTPDEHPTLTRFFTFRKVIDAMLTMDLIGLPQNMLKLEKIKPQEENQKRLKLVVRFFSRPEAKQALRRASLVLQLTGGLEAMVSSKVKEGQPPKIVSFVKGEAHAMIADRLLRLFGAMPKDPLLELGPATSNILATAVDLILRFNKLQAYPFRLCRLCKKWFTVTYLQAILEFLHSEADTLDVGVSMQLRDIAWKERNEAQALAWIASEPVQNFLEQICHKLLCHSLDAERKAAQVKQWEGRKVTHIATASLNNICARFAKEREAKSLAIERAIFKLRKVQNMRGTSIAWKDESLRPDGIRFQPGNTFKCESSCKQTHPLGSSCLQRAGSKRTIDQVEIDNHTFEQSKMVAEAKDEVEMLLQTVMTPITRSQWGDWLLDNIVEFRKRMPTAFIERRQRNSPRPPLLAFTICYFISISFCIVCVM